MKNYTGLVFNGTFFAMTVKVRFSNSCENYALENNVSISSLGRYVFGSEISYNKAPPRLPGLGC
jgi:hypothetical protein